LVLVLAGSVDGAGPVAVEQDETVEPKIHFKAPQQPIQLTFSATAVIVGDGWPAPVRIPVEATIAGISIRAAIRRLTIVQGGTATAQLEVTSFGGPETVEFVMFAAPQGIRIEGGSTRVSLAAGQTVPFSLTFRADPDATLGVHELQGLVFRTLDGQVQGSLDHFLTFDVRIGNSFDDSVVWAPASGLAIALDTAKDAWLSGHVEGIIPLRDGAVLVRTHTGGVWAVARTGAAFPHSDDWDDPDVRCLASGPNGLNHFYAGCSRTLRESEPGTELLGFIHWHEIPLRDGNGAPLSTGGFLTTPAKLSSDATRACSGQISLRRGARTPLRRRPSCRTRPSKGQRSARKTRSSSPRAATSIQGYSLAPGPQGR
jgi:hypothetical protein